MPLLDGFRSRLAQCVPEDFDRLTLTGFQAGRSSKRPVLLSRGLYRTRAFDFSRLPKGERLKAAQLQATAWEPFLVSTCRIGVRSSRAVAFAWDDSWAEKAASEFGIGGRLLLPEGVFRRPIMEGVRLHACLDGFEGQVWQEGMLIDSRWWPGLPDPVDWLNFLRGHVPSTDALPPLADAGTPWQIEPWLAVSNPGELGRSSSSWERKLAWGGVCAVLGLAAYQMHEWVMARQVLAEARSRGSDLVVRSGSVLAAREEALRTRGQVERLAAGLAGVEPLDVMAQLAASLPGKGVQLQELLMEGRRVRVVLVLAPELQRSAVVQQLQATGFFADVSEFRDTGVPGSVGFQMLVSDRPAAVPEFRKVATP